MDMKEKIKQTLESMKKDGEIDKIKNFYKNDKEIQEFCQEIKEVNVMTVPIIPLIMSMPKEVMRDVLCYLMRD